MAQTSRICRPLEIAHGIVAMLFVAAMIGHIYIGTIGMEGAFEAMGTGTVDLNWAKEHHSLWLEEEKARADAGADAATAVRHGCGIAAPRSAML